MRYLALAFLAMAIPAMAQQSVAFTWKNGNTGTGAYPACTATVTTSCVTGFTLTMDSSTTVAGPSSIGPTATSYTQTPAPPAGNHTYSIAMNGFDGFGAAIVSTPSNIVNVTVPAVVTLNPPTGFTAKVQ